MTGDRRPGRPRSEQVRTAILTATIDELTDRGYAALTIEGIAARAGAGKQTIYRWWPSKADVVLDALLEMAAELVAVPDTGSLRGDLMAFLASTFRQRGQRPVLVGLMAQAVFDPVFGREFRDRFLFSRRDVLREILRRGVARGEISADEDLELVLDIVFGVLWYRLLLDHVPVTDAEGEQLASFLLRAIHAES